MLGIIVDSGKGKFLVISLQEQDIDKVSQSRRGGKWGFYEEIINGRFFIIDFCRLFFWECF